MESLILSLAMLSPVHAAAVEQLADDSFRNREAASRALRHLDPFCHAWLTRAQDCRDAEVRYRARVILRDGWMRADYPLVRPTNGAKIPWIDMLPFDHADRHAIIDDYLLMARVGVTCTGPPEWSTYRKASRLWVRDLILGGQSVADVRKLLDVMATAEAEYRRRRQE